MSIRLSGKEKMNLIFHLSTMLAAGIPILEAVNSLVGDTSGGIHKALLHIRTAINGGHSLSSSLEEMPDAFDVITINLIKAAEVGGTLDTTLKDVARFTEKDVEFKDSIRSSLIYPAFVMIVFLGIVVLMLTFVIPRIAKVFISLHVHMPLVTQLMIATSNIFLAIWPLISLAFAALLIAIAVIFKTSGRAISRGLFRLPGLRKLGEQIDLARFTRSMGLLLRSGIAVHEAIELSSRVVVQKRVLAVTKDMLENVDAGKPISEALRAHKMVIPAMMTLSIETAERSGTLEQTMQNLSEFFEAQVATSLKTITSLLEPVLIIIVGFMVAILMITIIAPIYGLISQISPRR